MKFMLAVFIIAGFVACNDRADTGPREIHYGEDVCERCKMIISDKRFAAQYIPQRGDAKKFDDIGCMLDELKEESKDGDGMFSIYVTDYATGEWIEAGKAFYLKNGELRTPMGYGIAAFGSEESMRASPYYKDGQELGGFDGLEK